MSRRHVLRVDSLASIFGRLEELVLAGSGEDDFEEIFKLLIAKLWDERHGGRSFSGSAGVRAAALERLLDGARREWPGILDGGARFLLGRGHLERCAEALGGVSLSAAGGEALDALFEFLTARAAKGAKGQFFTPRHVVELCVRLVAPARGETVCDPACGSGAFLAHAARRARVEAWGFDFDPRAARIAQAMQLVAGGGARIVRLNSLERPSIEAHFDGNFDVILTNPPFAGELRERAILDGYRFGRGRARVERDVLFIERCVELLRPGGRLAMVLPHNKLSGERYAELRGWLVEQLQVTAVIGLGRNTFMPHTSQKASVLVGVKRERPRSRGAGGGERIFFAVSERDGKTPQGAPLLKAGAAGAAGAAWERIDHDLDDIAQAYARHSGGAA